MSDQTIPWMRIAAESVAIVGSILLAFVIEAWWEDRQDRDHERTYLESLQYEFTEGLSIAAESEEIRKIAVAAHESLVAQIQGAERASDGDLYMWISLVSLPLRYNPPRAVFNDLVASGGTVLIESDDVRIALARYDLGLKNLTAVDDSAWAVWEQRLQPFLEGRIPRVERLRQGLAGERRTDVIFGDSPYDPDFDGVLSDPAFEDMLAERWLRLQNGLLNIRQLRAEGIEIVDLVESELAGL